MFEARSLGDGGDAQFGFGEQLFDAVELQSQDFLVRSAAQARTEPAFQHSS